MVARLLDCNSGEILKEVSCFNKQIQWGTDILSRIFYCKDNREKVEEVRRATVESICECMDKLDASHSAFSMVIAGNTTMIHFLLGMDAFCVFYTPHAVHADCPGFQLARDLDIPLKGYVSVSYTHLTIRAVIRIPPEYEKRIWGLLERSGSPFV